MAGKSDIEAGRAFVRLFLKNDLTKALTGALQSAGKSLKSAGDAMQSWGTKGMVAGAALATPLVAAVVAGAKFEDTLLDIRGSTGATADDMAKIEAAALGMRAGPASAAQSFLELLKAGMGLQDVLGGAGEVAIAFGKVGKMAAGESAVVLADAMKVFGESADVAANAISSAADASSTDIQGMAQAFSQASAVAKLANQGILDTSAALAILANNGIKGGDAGTSLKAMLLALTAPSVIAEKKLTELGMSTNDFRDAAGKMLPLSGIIGKVNEKLGGLGQAAKDEALKKIFGTDAIRAAAILGKAGPAGFEAMKKSMTEAMPISEKYNTMMGGLTGLYEDAKAGAERLAIVVSKALAPSLKIAGQWIGTATTWLTKFVEENKQIVVWVAAAAAGLLAGGAALMALGVVVSTIGSALGGLGGMIAFVAGTASRIGGVLTLPFRLLGSAASGAAGIVGGVLTGSIRVAASMLSGFGAAVRVPFVAIVSGAASAGAAIGSHVGRGIGVASVAVAQFSAQAIPVAINAIRGIGPAAKSAWDMIRTTADPAYLKATWQDIRAAAGRAFRSMRSDGFSFYKMLRTTMDPAYLKATWASIRTGAGVAFRSARASVFGLYNALRTARGAAAGLGTAMGRVGASIGRGVGRMGGAAGGLLGAAGMLGAMGIGGALAPVLAMAPLVVGVLGSIGTAVAAIASPVGLLAAAVVGGAVAWVKFSESGKSAWSGLLAVVLPIFETLKTTFAGVKDAIMSGDWAGAGAIAMAGLKVAFFQGLGGIESAFGDTFAAILRTVGRIGDGIVSAWDWVTGQLKTLWDNWGQGTLDTILEVAGLIPDIWQQAVEGIANSLLEMSAGGGPLGAIASKMLGVDMADEQKKAEAIEKAKRPALKRNLEWSIAEGKKQGTDTSALEADLAKLGGPQEKVDVLKDAREGVKQFAENLRKDLSAPTEAGTGRVSLALDEFLKKVESGVSLADAKTDFDRLQSGQQTDAYAAQFAAAMEGGGETAAVVSGTPGASGGPGGEPGEAPLTGEAVAKDNRFAGLTTYSAAAAQAIGFGGAGGGGGPAERTAKGVDRLAKLVEDQKAAVLAGNATFEKLNVTWERYITALSYG